VLSYLNCEDGVEGQMTYICVGQRTDWGKCLQYRIYEELLQINKNKMNKEHQKKKKKAKDINNTNPRKKSGQ